MAEVLGIIGSIGTIANIIHATSEVISTISILRGKWKDADLILLSLASQLSAFRAALRRIDEWIDSLETDPHHQLTMDLDETLSFCGLLINRIEKEFADWQAEFENPTASSARLKVALHVNDLDKIFVMVERQTNALTLLLTACNCKTLKEQRHLLEKPKTRKTFQRLKADSASLLVHRDATSLRSRITDTFSKLSLMFDFDGEVFSTSVYHRVFRASLKHQLREQQGGPMLNESPQGRSDIAVSTSDPTTAPKNIAQRIEPDGLSESQSLEARLSKTNNNEVLWAIHCCQEYMMTGRTLPSTRLSEREIGLRDSKGSSEQDKAMETFAEELWKQSDFEQVRDFRRLLSAPDGLNNSTSSALEVPPSMSMCRLFMHELKAFGDGPFPNRVKNCIIRLESACDYAAMQRSTASGHTDLDVYTLWSQADRFPRLLEVTVVISVFMSQKHFEPCSTEALAEEIDLYLQPLLREFRSRPARDISFVILLNGEQDLITNITACFTDNDHGFYLDVLLDQIILSFKQAKPTVSCQYITLWGSLSLNSHLLSIIEALVVRGGQVIKQNGVVKAKFTRYVS